MSTALVAYNPEPTSLVGVSDQCAAIEAWADTCDSIPEIEDWKNKLAAVDLYLSRTSTEGRARVAAAMRRLEIRVGVLVGEPRPGERTDLSLASDGLTPNERHHFRQMAEHSEIVEDAIAQSTDEQPASRRKVLESIREADTDRAPQRRPLPEDFMRAVIDLGKATERVCRLAADDRFHRNSDHIAEMHVHDLIRAHDSLSRVIEQLQGA